MKTLAYKIILFCIPLMVLCAIIFFINPPETYKINYLKEDCTGRYHEISVRLQNPKKIDILFIGSSKTMNAIDDSLLQSKTKKRCYNAGYCRFGRDLDVLFVEKFSAQFEIKQLFLEVREDESYSSHPVFPMLANGKEILNSATLFNQDFFSDCLNHFLFNLSWFRLKLGIEKEEAIIAQCNKDFGFWNGSVNVLDTTNYTSSHIEALIKPSKSTRYIQQVKKICELKHIQLHFLYLPNFNKKPQPPLYKGIYASLGNYISEPDSIYSNASLYQNEGHFNEKGATVFSNYLTTIIDK